MTNHKPTAFRKGQLVKHRTLANSPVMEVVDNLARNDENGHVVVRWFSLDSNHYTKGFYPEELEHVVP